MCSLNRALLIVCVIARASMAQTDFEKKTQDARREDGYFPYYWDAKAGKVWLEISRWNDEFLYLESLPAGIGSNDIGVDRGQLGAAHIVRFERSGPKVLLVAANYEYRSSSTDPAERLAVTESFAPSVLWGFEVAAEEGTRVLVDASAFFLRDAHGISARIQETDRSSYKVDPSRSAFYSPGTRNFPDNTEVEATLTLTGGPPGKYLRGIVQDRESVTVRQHHSFIRLPGPGYTPRAFDPRAGYFGIDFMDLTVPLGERVRQRYISRHRLAKRDPSANVSDPVKPIVYYLDRGAPEPIRSALLEGARWWNQAFEAAGYRNAFQVELMPEGMDPMDIRYNIIQWVHRATRGWSYGAGVTDPRTGEIIKGKVTLGSLRARQDYLIAEALLTPYESGRPIPPDMREMVLARMRQLSAHEVGHTLGLSHNYIASAQGDASVMDYPHPKAELTVDGEIDLSKAYRRGIGEWDKVAIEYGYRDFAPGVDQRTALTAIIQGAIQRGLWFISDPDARPEGSAHPQVHLWDNGPDPVDELNRWMQVRAKALSNFSEKSIREGEPMALLKDTLVPLYLSHRYQVEAVSKVLGGLYYTYALRGDGQPVTRKVPPEQQRKALRALLATLQPDALAIPERLLPILPPWPEGYTRTRESFPSRSGLTFDPLAAAETAADITVSMLLHPERAQRLVEYHARDNPSPGLAEVIDELLRSTWKAASANAYETEIRRTVDQVVLFHLTQLAASEPASPQVRAMAGFKLRELKRWLGQHAWSGDSEKAWAEFAVAQIDRFEREPKTIPVPSPAPVPPGMPIGEW